MRFVLIVFLLASLRGFSQGFPCPTTPDTLTPLQFETDTLLDSGLAAYLECLNNGCPQEACHTYEFPDSFAGYFTIGMTNNGFQTLNIQIWEDCNFLRMDTCVFVGDPFIAPFILRLEFPVDAQVTICGPASDSITVFIKPFDFTDTLPPAQVKLDTLCGTLIGVPSPAAKECLWTPVDTKWQPIGPAQTPPLEMGYYKCGLCGRKIYVTR